MFNRVFISIISLVILNSCKSTPKNPDTPSPSITNTATSNTKPETPLNWPSQMQELTKTYGELLPLLSDSQSFSNPEQKKLISKKMDDLKILAHTLNEKTPTPDKDPSIRFISDRFEQNIQLALDSLQAGHFEFSRGILRNSLAQCVQCHTRLEIGPSLTKPDYIQSLKTISVVERIQFLIASRYFKEALNELDNAFQNSENLSIVAWQKLVQLGFTLHIRFHGDVKQTENFLVVLNKNKNIPFFIKRNITYWQSSLKNWKQNHKSAPTLKNATDLIANAEKLQKESRSEGGLIEYLRAAHILHQFLATEKPNPIKAQALYELGLIYENIGEIGAWSMNEDYYELCVRLEPHSEIAQKCFARYQESLVSGYSGTGGLYIPQDIQNKINELRSIAL